MKLFVVLHNVFLAVYSAWTFVGMFLAFRSSFPDTDIPAALVDAVDQNDSDRIDTGDCDW
jgi:hypothetical protein